MRSVSRSFLVLNAMNASAGPHTVVELSRTTGISRQATYRIIDTLSELGYVQRENDSSGFQLTHLVRTLSRGFDEESWITEIAFPVMRELQHEIIWPTDLATYLNNGMYLRETTRRFSPWTIDKAMVGLRLPMLESATGRAYLAFCPGVERDAIVAGLRRSLAPGDARARDRRYVDRMITRTLENGYGERHGELIAETGAIAVPLFRDGRVLACLNATFIASALTPFQAATKYLEPIKRAAIRIEHGLAKDSLCA